MQSSSTTQRPSSIWGTSAANLWAVGASGTLLTYDGATWHTADTPAGAAVNLTSVWGTGEPEAWAVGVNATILH